MNLHPHCLVLLLAFCVNSLFGQPQYPSYLWEITSNAYDKPSYLFGTAHTTNKESFVLPDSLYYGIMQTDAFAVEIDMDTMMLTLIQMLTDQGHDFWQFDSLRLDDKDNENSAGNSFNFWNPDPDEAPVFMDLYFLNLASSAGKEIRALEPLENQMSLMEDRITESFFSKLAEAWIVNIYTNHGLDSIASIGGKLDFIDSAFVQRNLDLTDGMEKVMRAGKSLFAAMGALHLPGKQGVLQMLEQRGYTCRPVVSANHVDFLTSYPLQFSDDHWVMVDEGNWSARLPSVRIPIDLLEDATFTLGIDIRNLLFSYTLSLNSETLIQDDNQMRDLVREMIDSTFEIKAEGNTTLDPGYFNWDLRSFANDEGIHMRHCALSDGPQLAILVFAGSEQTMSHAIIDSAIQSVRFNELDQSWHTISSAEGGFEVSMPGKSEFSATSMMETYEFGSFQNTVYQWHANSLVADEYLLRYEDWPPGIVPKSDSTSLTALDSVYFNLLGALQVESRREFMVSEHYRAAELIYALQSGDWVKQWTISRGCRLYFLLQWSEDKVFDDENFFGSFQMLDFIPAPTITEEFSDVGITLNWPGQQRYEPDSSFLNDLSEQEEILTYAAKDTHSGTQYVLEIHSQSRYSGNYQTDTFANSYLDGLLSQDQLVSRTKVDNALYPTYLQIGKRPDVPLVEIHKSIFTPLKVFNLTVYTPEENKMAVLEAIATFEVDDRFTGDGQDSATDRMLSDLVSQDSVLSTRAFYAIRNFNFANNDSSALLSALDNYLTSNGSRIDSSTYFLMKHANLVAPSSAKDIYLQHLGNGILDTLSMSYVVGMLLSADSPPHQSFFQALSMLGDISQELYLEEVFREYNGSYQYGFSLDTILKYMKAEVLPHAFARFAKDQFLYDSTTSHAEYSIYLNDWMGFLEKELALAKSDSAFSNGIIENMCMVLTELNSKDDQSRKLLELTSSNEKIAMMTRATAVLGLLEMGYEPFEPVLKELLNDTLSAFHTYRTIRQQDYEQVEAEVAEEILAVSDFYNVLLEHSYAPDTIVYLDTQSVNAEEAEKIFVYKYKYDSSLSDQWFVGISGPFPVYDWENVDRYNTYTDFSHEPATDENIQSIVEGLLIKYDRELK